MATVSDSEIAPVVISSGGFEGLLNHWAQARIDSPLTVIGRFDEAARQLITVSSVLQAAYIAAFGFGNLKTAVPLWTAFLAFLPLISLVFCAAKVICTVPAQLRELVLSGDDRCDGRRPRIRRHANVIRLSQTRPWSPSSGRLCQHRAVNRFTDDVGGGRAVHETEKHDLSLVRQGRPRRGALLRRHVSEQ